MYTLRINFISTILLLSIVLFPLKHIHAWECEITLEGPDTIKVGQIIMLFASGAPDGGSYSWSNTPNLVPNGSIAMLTGFVPSFSDYIRVIVTYTSPKGKRCSAMKWIWVCACYVKINGPNEVNVGEAITLSAEGDPSGGTYAWDNTPGLVSNGSTAEFTGQTEGDVTIEVTYTIPDVEPCTDTHAVTVSGECSVTITGPSVVGVGNSITLTASGNPSGGIYIWKEQPGLIPGISSAMFFGKTPGGVTIEVTYEPPQGLMCTDTHYVTAFGVESISSPSCVKSGKTLTKEDFRIVTTPPGYEDLVIVRPLSFSTSSQSEEVTVTAYSGTGMASDEATTTITVVNSNVKNEKGISFEIPNCLNEVLKNIGLGDKTDLSVKDSFKDYKECCGFGVGTSVDGSFAGSLSIDAGPFTIVGVPMPPKIRKWVTADLVNVTLSGSGSVGIDGSYKVCEDKTDWSGGGDLTAGVSLGGGITAIVPSVIILKGVIKGSTSITEKLRTELTNLKLTTNWGGLTGEAIGIIKIPPIKFKASFEAKKTYLEHGDLLPLTISLPSLEQE